MGNKGLGWELASENIGTFSLEGPAPKWSVGMALGVKVRRTKILFSNMALT